jgi:rubrerythrin
MAIEALNRSENPNNSDCISRQAAIDAIDEISREVDDGDGFDYAKWREYFCELPPAEPQTGKWVDDGDPLTLTCGNCGYGVMRYNAMRFCPHCGADMRGEQK